MLEKEMIELAKKYKKKIAGAFVLVDSDDIERKVAGSQFVATKKMDGSLQALFYEDGKISAVSTSGKVITDLPCLNEAAKQLKNYGLKSAVIEAELYAVLEEGKRERVSDAIKAIADETLWDKLFLAPFDVVSLDGQDYRSDSYLETLKTLNSIFKGNGVKPVEYKELESIGDVVSLYKEWVEEGGAEGIVLHSELPIIYKIKARHSIDGVIVGFSYGEKEKSNSIRDVAMALKRPDGLLQIIGVTGSGFTAEQESKLVKELEPLICNSEYIITDSRNVAFQMVKPKIVAEFSVGDLVSEGSDGTSKINPLLKFDEAAGYLSEGNTAGVSTIHLVFERFREDKTADESDVRISQVTDICPFSSVTNVRIKNLPKSEIIAKRIFTKGSGEKLMIQKYVVWKTNKEESSLFPSYVFFYTDFSTSRKEMLKHDMRISSSLEQAMSMMENTIAENVKKGWTEMVK